MYKQWLNKEYDEWAKALQESTVNDFKEHHAVKRMLGDVNAMLFPRFATPIAFKLLSDIDRIGRHNEAGADITGVGVRMIYYAQEILKLSPKSVCEIGGGVGQLFAIMRALGYTGDYYIFDLYEVQEFQRKYLAEVENQTGLSLKQRFSEFNFCCSFYALGEFDDETKESAFQNIVNECEHGYVAWNPHSGASDDLTLFKHKITVTPGIEEGVKIITW